MASPEELDDLAAELALGTLPEAERAEALRLMAEQPGFAAQVQAWEERLGPLALALPEEAAPPRVRGNVMRAIAGETQGGASSVVDFKRKADFWRNATIGLGVIAASLAGFIAFNANQPAAPDQRFVAVLATDGTGPAFLASIDLANGQMSVRPVAAAPQPGKSYELWAIGGGRAKPQSLGVIDASLKVPAERLGALNPATLADTLFAVTIEPEGGSPTGDPSGPPVYSGKLVATE